VGATREISKLTASYLKNLHKSAPPIHAVLARFPNVMRPHYSHIREAMEIVDGPIYRAEVAGGIGREFELRQTKLHNITDLGTMERVSVLRQACAAAYCHQAAVGRSSLARPRVEAASIFSHRDWNSR
jgi:hypothetical protein